jgi:hypothetical protein
LPSLLTSHSEEIDLLFTPNRTIFVFWDKEATRKGRLLHTDLVEGENVALELKKALNRSTAVGGHDSIGIGTAIGEVETGWTGFEQ